MSHGQEAAMTCQALRTIALSLLVITPVFSDDRSHVVMRGEGEKLFGGGVIIKASPRTGSQSAEVIWGALPPGQSTGLHAHHRRDEFFYVLAGKGVVLAAGKEVPVETGDVIFVAKGQWHKLTNADPVQPLETVILVDKPGLADEFRGSHAQFGVAKKLMTLDEVNKITKKYGTTYKTLQ